jgi:hypothetical protein
LAFLRIPGKQRPGMVVSNSFGICSFQVKAEKLRLKQNFQLGSLPFCYGLLLACWFDCANLIYIFKTFPDVTPALYFGAIK